MALRLRFGAHAGNATATLPFCNPKHSSRQSLQFYCRRTNFRRAGVGKCQIRASDGGAGQGDTYLDMWKRAVEREKKEKQFQRILESTSKSDYSRQPEGDGVEDLERKTMEFEKILEVPREERDRVQRMQVIDRAAAAIAAARAIVDQNPLSPQIPTEDGDRNGSAFIADSSWENRSQYEGKPSTKSYDGQIRSSKIETPGPDFWSWIPPPEDDTSLNGSGRLQNSLKSSSGGSIMNILEKDRSANILGIPFESKLYESKIMFSLPPLQSWLDREKGENTVTITENAALLKDHEVQFTEHAVEAARALEQIDEKPSQGRNFDGSRWWRDVGVERRSDGVVYRWTMVRGVTADEAVEWEEKYWEAADESGYKELGSEKSGRDVNGNVWHEYWRESMWQVI